MATIDQVIQIASRWLTKFNPTERVAVCIAGGAFCVLFCYALLFHINAPYGDYWALTSRIEMIDAFSANTDTAETNTIGFAKGEVASLLLTPHGPHLIAGGLVFMLPAAYWFEFEMWPVVVTSLLAAAMSGVLLWRLMSEVFADLGMSQIGPIGALMSVLTLWSFDQGLNWLWAWQICLHLCLLFFLLSIFLLTRSSDGLVDRCRIDVLAFLSAFASAMCFAAGVVAIPAGAAVILLRSGRVTTKDVMLAGLWFAIGVFLLGTVFLFDPKISSVSQADQVGESASYLELVEFILAAAGGPVARAAKWASPVFGLAVIVLLLLGTMRVKERVGASRSSPRTLSIIVALGGFAIGAAFLIAYGRVSFGVEQALAGRYVTFTNLFWIAGLPCVLVLLTHEKARGMLRLSICLVASLAISGKAISSLGQAYTSAKFARYVDAAALRVAKGYPMVSAADLAALGLSPSDAEPRLEFIATREWNLFSGRQDKSEQESD